MYLTSSFTIQDSQRIAQLFSENPFGSVISHDAELGLLAADVPVTLVNPEAPSAEWILEFHLAKPNPQCEVIASGAPLLITIQGPNGYVSPNWYGVEEAVPTWNYLAVHCHGIAQEQVQLEAKDALLKRLIAQHEPAFASQWTAMPQEYKSRQLSAIRAFQMPISRLQAKAKLSQNRTADIRTKVFQAHQQGTAQEQALAEWMQRLGLQS